MYKTISVNCRGIKRMFDEPLGDYQLDLPMVSREGDDLKHFGNEGQELFWKTTW